MKPRADIFPYFINSEDNPEYVATGYYRVAPTSTSQNYFKNIYHFQDKKLIPISN